MFFTIIYSVAGLLLALTLFSFIYQAVRALRFRRNIADTHGFTEGIMTGPWYPLMVMALSLLFIQFLALIIFKPQTELMFCARVLAYLLNFAAFYIFKHRVPPLLAYWFGKTALWDNFGIGGKIPYSDIYCATLSRNIRFPMMNTQQLCKFSFYSKNREHRKLPKRFVCKMTAYELTALASQVDFYSHSDGKTAKKEQLNTSCIRRILPFIESLCAISAVLLLFSFGIFYAPRYDTESFDRTQKIETITDVSSIKMTSDYSLICIYYENIGAADIYTSDGFAYSILLPSDPLCTHDIALTSNNIYFRNGNKVHTLLASNGLELLTYSSLNDFSELLKATVSANEVSTPDRFELSSLNCWLAFVTLLTAVFSLHFAVSDPTPPAQKETAQRTVISPEPTEPKKSKKEKKAHTVKEKPEISKKEAKLNSAQDESTIKEAKAKNSKKKAHAKRRTIAEMERSRIYDEE